LLITNVELRNVKNHAEAEFSFQPGVIAICGPNGAGKTTILEAIAWALFDHLEYKRDDFVKRGAKRGQVSVRFRSDLDEREYIVTRDTAGAYFVYDPITKTKLVEQKNQVIPWLQRHLGVEPGGDLAALFKNTIGVPQGAFAYDFTLPPANRKSVFDQILKVEEYRRASDNLRETLRHIESRISEADKKLAEAEGELKAYDEIRREHDAAQSRLDALERDLAQATAERDRLAREAESLDRLLGALETGRGVVERLTVKLEFTRDSLAVAREAAEQARAAAIIVESVRGGYERYAAAAARMLELEKQRVARDELRGRIAGIERELIETRSQSKRLEERLAEVAAAREELASLAERIAGQQALETLLAALREERGELQSLRRSIEPLDGELERLRQRYASLQKEIETAEALRERAARAEALEAERASLEGEINRKELEFGRLKLRREQREALRGECARLAEDVAQTRAAIERLEPVLAVSARLAGIESEQQQQTEALAHLRAEVARDDEMIGALDRGGLCPLLTEKCLNLKPGESLDARFRSGLTARREQIAERQRRLAAIAGELKQSREAAAEAARLPHLQAELARLVAELGAKREQAAALEREDGALAQPDIDRLRLRRAEVERELRDAHEAGMLLNRSESLRAEMDDVRKTGEAKRRERDALGERIAALGEVEQRIAGAETELRALDDPRGHAASLQRLIEREAEFLRDADAAARQASAVNADLEQALVAFEVFAALDARITDANAVRTASEPDYHAFIQNEKIAGTAAAREQDAATIAAEAEESRQALAAARDELAGLERRYDAARHRSLQSSLDAQRDRSTQLATQRDHLRESLARLQTQLARLEDARARQREQLAERERSRHLRETADFIRDILQKAAPFITESYLFSISAEANQLFREITGRYDVSLRWTKDYEITLEENGYDRPFVSLSGGEQMAAALAVRLALLKELSDINLAFFDEPTAHMDEERRRNLAQQIGRIKDFHQLFVVTHDDSFEGYTDQIITLET
jgi:exonuclease SbcC